MWDKVLDPGLGLSKNTNPINKRKIMHQSKPFEASFLEAPSSTPSGPEMSKIIFNG